MRINKIQNKEGEWLTQQEDIVEATIDFYKKQFTKKEDNDDFQLPKELPVVINNEMNEELQSIPTRR